MTNRFEGDTAMGSVEWESFDLGVLECELSVKRVLVRMADGGELTQDQALAFVARLRASMADVRHLAERQGSTVATPTCASMPSGERCGRCGVRE